MLLLEFSHITNHHNPCHHKGDGVAGGQRNPHPVYTQQRRQGNEQRQQENHLARERQEDADFRFPDALEEVGDDGLRAYQREDEHVDSDASHRVLEQLGIAREEPRARIGQQLAHHPTVITTVAAVIERLSTRNIRSNCCAP